MHLFFQDEAQQLFSPGGGGGESQALRRYKVNQIIDHADSTCAPVVHEENPTYQNLFGRVEHMAQMGALITDFDMIRSGAVHRANGGFLVLDALKVLMEPFTWEGLKRPAAFRKTENRVTRSEVQLDQYSLPGAGTDAPEGEGDS